jgi:hypothetical protein
VQKKKPEKSPRTRARLAVLISTKTMSCRFDLTESASMKLPLGGFRQRYGVEAELLDDNAAFAESGHERVQAWPLRPRHEVHIGRQHFCFARAAAF